MHCIYLLSKFSNLKSETYQIVYFQECFDNLLCKLKCTFAVLLSFTTIRQIYWIADMFGQYCYNGISKLDISIQILVWFESYQLCLCKSYQKWQFMCETFRQGSKHTISSPSSVFFPGFCCLPWSCSYHNCQESSALPRVSCQLASQWGLV